MAINENNGIGFKNLVGIDYNQDVSCVNHHNERTGAPKFRFNIVCFVVEFLQLQAFFFSPTQA
jgi:hypothetical protein